MEKQMQWHWKGVFLYAVVGVMMVLAYLGTHKQEPATGTSIRQSAQPVLFMPERRTPDTIKVPWDGSSIRLYPNPVKYTLHVVAPRAAGSYVWLAIYQPGGQLVKKYAVQTGRVMEINVQKLPGGQYLLRMGDRQGEKWSGKFMKTS